jgi:hypothetical protein
MTRTATGGPARALAARLARHGYRVMFPPGRDPAVFKVTGLPGDPDVEVTAEHSGQAACHYVGRTTAEAAGVIARLPQAGATEGDTLTAAWDGIEVEWHCLPQDGPGCPDRVAAALLAHLDVLGGRDERKDVPA